MRVECCCQTQLLRDHIAARGRSEGKTASLGIEMSFGVRKVSSGGGKHTDDATAKP